MSELLHELLAVALWLGIAAGLFVFRQRLGTFVCLGAFLLATLAYLLLGFDPAIPASAFKLYAALLVVAVLLYATSSERTTEEFWGPIRSVMVKPALKPALYAGLLLIPAAVAAAAFYASLPRAAPPPKVRSVHPAQPTTITFQPPGATEPKTINVVEDPNPLRPLATTDPTAFAEKVAHGKVVYYENCFFCHGDTLAGNGHFALAVKPAPADFQDPGVLPMFTESFFFWRISKGGPGLPDEATPFDSSMPVWEKYLQEEDIWSALLFMYDYTGRDPRANEASHAGGDMTSPAPAAGGHP